MLELILGNTEIITTVGGLILSVAVPYLAPANVAKFVNVWKVLKVAKNVLIAIDNKVDKIEKSKGGFTSETAKEVLLEDIKSEAKDKISEVISKKGIMSKDETLDTINEILNSKDEIVEKVQEVKTLSKTLIGLFK